MNIARDTLPWNSPRCDKIIPFRTLPSSRSGFKLLLRFYLKFKMWLAKGAFLTITLLIASSVVVVHSKIYKKCEVVRKLEENGVPKSLIATFVCLSESESGMNSSSVTKTPSDVTSYGIFQVGLQ